MHVCTYTQKGGELLIMDRVFTGDINLSKSNTKYAANSETQFSEINNGETVQKPFLNAITWLHGLKIISEGL